MKDDLEHDKMLDKISRKISFLAVNPKNSQEEKERFFAEPDHEPHFRYKPHQDLQLMRERLESIRPSDSAVGKILADIRDRYLNDIRLIDSRGTEDFTKISKELYGFPDNNLLKEAKRLIYLKVKKEDSGYATSQIIRKLRLAFMKYGFPWQVEEKDMVAAAAVKTEKKKLFIRRRSSFSENFLKRIIVHEIGTHIMRAENGSYQPYSFFMRGLPGYLMTEEGLAVYNEEQNDCLNNYILKIYAGRVLAIDCALRSSFRKTYELMRKYFTRRNAWRLTLRAKRGLGDSSKPGAFTKDIAYLQGYLEIKRFAQQGGDISKLYYGKIGLQHIDLVERLPGIVNPHYLPMARYLNYFSGHFSKVMRKVVLLDSLQQIDLDPAGLRR